MMHRGIALGLCILLWSRTAVHADAGAAQAKLTAPLRKGSCLTSRGSPREEGKNNMCGSDVGPLRAGKLCYQR